MIDKLQAGILASLLVYHYLKKAIFSPLNIFSSNGHKAEVNLIVESLIKIREGKLATKNLELLKNELVSLAKTDEKLLSLLKEWSTPSFQFLNQLKKDYSIAHLLPVKAMPYHLADYRIIISGNIYEGNKVIAAYNKSISGNNFLSSIGIISECCRSIILIINNKLYL